MTITLTERELSILVKAMTTETKRVNRCVNANREALASVYTEDKYRPRMRELSAKYTAELAECEALLKKLSK